MPALLTHDYFGTDVWTHLGDSIFPAPDDKAFAEELRRIFLLGNQGPDPFFYALRTTRLARIKKFGSRMHHEKADETLDAFRRLASSLPKPERDMVQAYLLGFSCHFALDSTMHPFVYAQQYAICDAGVEGLDRRDGSVVHGQIEADLDMMLLRQRRGEGLSTYNYTRNVLGVGDGVLELLDAVYEAIAHEVYAIDLPSGAFSRGVRDMRLTIAVLYSSHGFKRRLIGRVERLFRRHSFAQAMSPRHDVGVTCDFDNRGHDPWKHPFTGEISSAGFDELYARALATAYDTVAALLEGRPAAAITRGLDFEGA